MKLITCLKYAMLLMLCFSLSTVEAQNESKKFPSMKILVHITCGPENPTKAALGFLMARTAIEEGHTVTLFLAGDAVQLFRNDVLDNLAGHGTGK